MSVNLKAKPKPTRKLFHCDPAFKKMLTGHTKCHKFKSPSFLSGRKLNAYLNANVLMEDVDYRVCSNMADIVVAHKVVPRRQSTIIQTERLPRLAHDKVARRECVRKAMESFDVMVQLKDERGNPDFKKQITALKAKFVWMAEYGQVGTKTTLFHKTDGDRLVRWVEVKISGLEGAGLGLFAARKFLEGDVITVYLGREVEKDIDSVYSITNHNIVLDCKPFEDGDTLLGAHLANDPNWSRKEGGGGFLATQKLGNFLN